jgi:hypothetical protein
MRVIVEQLVECELAGETEVLGENLPQRHFIHHKSHMTINKVSFTNSAILKYFSHNCIITDFWLRSVVPHIQRL